MMGKAKEGFQGLAVWFHPVGPELRSLENQIIAGASIKSVSQGTGT